MIKKFLLLMFLAISCFAQNDPPIQFSVQPYRQEGGNSNDTLMRYQLDQNNNEIYRQLSNKPNLSGNNTFAGTNTFTSAPIMSNGINTGGKHWEVIVDSYTLVDTTYFEITGLNGDIDKEYDVSFTFYSQASASPYYFLRFNDDSSGLYAYNYPGRDSGVGSTLVYLGSNGTFVVQNNLNSGRFNIVIGSTGISHYYAMGWYQGFVSLNLNAGSHTNELLNGWFQYYGVNSIVSMKFECSTPTNSFKAGSHVVVKALR